MCDYVPGKADWLAHGRPVEGAAADVPTAGRLAHDDVVTCGLEDPVSEVRARVESSPYGFALVTAQGGVLLGRLRASVMKDSDGRAQDLMQPGPSTVRCDTPAGELAERLARRDLRTAVVSTPEGDLVGVVLRSELTKQAR